MKKKELMKRLSAISMAMMMTVTMIPSNAYAADEIFSDVDVETAADAGDEDSADVEVSDADDTSDADVEVEAEDDTADVNVEEDEEDNSEGVMHFLMVETVQKRQMHLMQERVLRQQMQLYI